MGWLKIFWTWTWCVHRSWKPVQEKQRSRTLSAKLFHTQGTIRWLWCWFRFTEIETIVLYIGYNQATLMFKLMKIKIIVSCFGYKIRWSCLFRSTKMKIVDEAGADSTVWLRFATEVGHSGLSYFSWCPRCQTHFVVKYC